MRGFFIWGQHHPTGSIPSGKGANVGAPKILIVGGGVIGLAIAENLRRKGATCALLDQGPFAQEASWAGAGYLDLRSAARVGGAFFEVCLKSYDLFPGWVEALKKESGLDPEWVGSGSLDLAFRPEEERAVQSLENSLGTFGLKGEWLSTSQALKREPGLSPELRSAFLFKQTAQVRPPRLTRALLKVLQKSGTELRELEGVEDFLKKGNKIVGVRTSKGVHSCDQVILASGAWTGLLAEKLGINLLVKPIRGQVVMYRADPKDLKHILFWWGPKGFTYLVPRLDGHIYVGSTLEDVGFDKATTPEVLGRLKEGATRVLPGLSQKLTEGSWAGLRPSSLDGWPYLGPVPGWEGLWVASGHYTHGLLLSAATGRLMAQAVLGEKTDMDLTPFAIQRVPHSTAGI